MNCKLTTYQKDNLRFVVERYNNYRSTLFMKGAIIGDQMGLGKTICALSLISKIFDNQENFRFLIVTPVSLYKQWINKLKTFFPELENKYYAYVNQKQILLDKPIILTTYNMISKKESRLKLVKYKYDITIGDEFHYLKNSKAQRTYSFFPEKHRETKGTTIYEASEFILGLTGTLINNGNSKDLHCVFKYLNGKSDTLINAGILMQDFVAYFSSKQNIIRHNGMSILTYSGVTNNPIKKEILLKAKDEFIIAHTEKEVADELPNQHFEDILLTSPKDIKDEFLKEAQKELCELLESCKKDEDTLFNIFNNLVKPKLDVIMSSYHIIETQKIPDVIEFIKRNKENERFDNIIVATGYRQTEIKLYEELVKSKVLDKKHIAIINGEVSFQKRNEIVEKLQKNPKHYEVVIANRNCITEGISFSTSNCMCIMSYNWKPSDMEQLEGRIRRKDSTNRIAYYYYFVYETGIDQLFRDMLKVKKKHNDRFNKS